MLLKNLIKKTEGYKHRVKNLNIKNLSLDSRKVKRGDLFFALRGSINDGNNFINHAITKGAAAIICSKRNKIASKKVPIIKLKNPKNALVFACQNFFKNKPRNIIAVTGTNGKSSVADFFYQILKKNKIKVASIGTLGIKKKGTIKKTNLTSLDIISLHRELFNLKKSGINNVILEASSHGLQQGRLEGINYKIGIFTNFSQDHLDYHKSMSRYFKSKMILFSKILKKNSKVIINKDTKNFSKIKKICLKKKLKMFNINENLIIKPEQIKLIGRFQIQNLLMSILAANLCGLNLKKINKVLDKIENVSGRLEHVRTLKNKAKIFIDFAHTPDALETVLRALQDRFNRKVSIIFGCGGERDRKKRKKMARVAQKYCDKIYVTDDNPRRENPKSIRKEITKYLKRNSYYDIGNRTKAIKYAISHSEIDEIILIAGKGHETTQDYGRKIIQISDKSVVRKISDLNKKFSKDKINSNINSSIIKKISKRDIKFKGVSIDSRNLKKGNLFIALKGKKRDGNNYVKQAIKKGANLCVVSKSFNKNKIKKIFKHKNKKLFLNQLARLKRISSSAKIVGVTGSSGKTTVKTYLGKVLDNFGPTYFSPKSFNNHYGVPLSLCNLENNHKFGVFEIGMSKAGEINNLSKLVKPDIGIITNIGAAHIENFSNLRGIAQAKGEIIDNIQDKGTLIINDEIKFYKYFKKKAEKKNLKLLSFGNLKKSEIRLVKIKKLKNFKEIEINVLNKKYFFKLQNTSNTNIKNILCCIAVIKALGLNLERVVNLFYNLPSLAGRGKIYKVNRFSKKFKLIDESYNANPLSVKSSILNLSKIHNKKNEKKYLLLGDMLELGNKSDFYHENLSKIINSANIDKLFVYGEKIFKTYKNISEKKRGNILHYKEDFDEVFSSVIKNDDFLMIKGSNATGLNKISKKIIKGINNAL